MGAPLTKKDFVSEQEVKWCPGCGDYAILAAMQKVLPEMGIAHEKIVFISGIGCSSRFPYYMNTYGFHTIHGRAPAFATGLALSRPDLSIWVISGDGDGLSIGGNHLIHALRRNININILLFNNQTYGLTKGQYSPTSKSGTVSKSTPFGSVDRPFSPLSLAIGAGASFVARTNDKDQKHMGEIFKKAVKHEGTSFVEIYQNCVIFNDNVYEDRLANKEERAEHILYLEDKKPLLFGKNNDKTIRFNGLKPEIVNKNEISEKEIYIHDETDQNYAYSYLLSQFSYPEFPEVMGVLKAEKDEKDYASAISLQTNNFKNEQGIENLNKLLLQGDTWEVK